MSNNIIKINKYRTIAEIYPYTSFESEIEIDNKVYYFNIDVNEQQKIDLENNEWWSYTKSLDDKNLDVDEDFICLDDSINNKILNAMSEIWNNSLTWDYTNKWNDINIVVK